jgi:spermidine synthase
MMRFLLFTTIFITGLCSLAYQVIWQGYLNILVGSEARSSTLVVAVFLIGLSLGYYYFGGITQKIKSRRELLKYYGWIELITGVYACLFPKFLKLFFVSDISQTNNFIIHLIMTSILIIPPTILMGATIPCMTAVVPENNEDVGSIHSSIYGINTIGAFVGCIGAGLWVIPTFGYELSVIIFGGINTLFAFIYIFNNLEGEIEDRQTTLYTESKINNKNLYFFAFVVGLTTLAIEILWFRLLGLAIGSSYIIFPVIVSIYVLAIGFGSILIKDYSEQSLRKNLYYTLISSLVPFVMAPYIPIIASNIRVSFDLYDLSFYLYHAVIYIILLLIIGPSVFFSGKILPLLYAFIKKDSKSFGKDVGTLYFMNTVGTFIGSVVFGYLLFNFLQIEQIYKIILVILCLATVILTWNLKTKKIIVLSIVIIILVVQFPFYRNNHISGLFRYIKPIPGLHFNNIFEAAKRKTINEVIYFKDDPNTTVSVTLNDKTKNDYSVYVNGKSDGATFGDFSTTALLGILPAAIHPSNQQKHAIVGIGTGITAGLVANFSMVKSVDVIEISQAIIDGTKILGDANFNYQRNSKITIHKMDAFQFFKQAPNKYDVIISEPSNPWVNGIENLYTTYFYEQVKENLTHDGILVQWAHTYAVDSDVIHLIVKNLGSSFKSVRAFITSPGDIAFIASNNDNQLNLKNISDEFLQKTLIKIGINAISEMDLLEVLTPSDFSYMYSLKMGSEHEIFNPKLSRIAYKTFWKNSNYKAQEWIDPFIARHLAPKQAIKNKYLSFLERIDCKDATVQNTICELVVKKYQSFIKNFKNGTNSERIVAYSVLRKDRFLEADTKFLRQVFKRSVELKDKPLMVSVMQEMIKDGDFDSCLEAALHADENQMLTESEVKNLSNLVESLKIKIKNLGS